MLVENAVEYNGVGFELVLSLRTDCSVDMSGQISSRRRHLSTKQWSGNKCGDVPTKIQTSNYAMDHRDWPGKQRLAEHQACRCTHLQHFSQTVKPFWSLILLSFFFMNPFFFKIVHYYVDRTESLSTYIFSKLLFCRQFCRQSACRRQHYFEYTMFRNSRIK